MLAIVAVLAVAALSVAVVAVAHRRTARGKMLTTPPPATVADLATSGPPPPSSVALPVTVALGPLAARLEKAVPKHFGSLDQRLPVRGVQGLTLALQLSRAPFQVSFVGDQAVVHATVTYALKAWYHSPFGVLTAACGNGGPKDPRLSLTVRGPIRIEPDWSLHTHARLSELRPASSKPRDRCRVTGLGLDITNEVVQQARTYLESQAAALDTALARVDVRTPVSRGWQALEQPVPLGDSLWLLVHPESVRRGPVHGLGDSVRITLGLRARPTVVVGAPPAASDVPLPTLDSGAVSPRFDVRVAGRAGYEEATRLLQRELGGTRVREVGRTLVLDSLKVFGIGGGKLAVEVRVGGAASARLYLTGTPRLDPATGQITIPDLDFDIRTRDLALKAESWLLGDRLRDLLRDQARWPTPADIARMRAQLQGGLNRKLSPGLSVQGAVDSLRVDAVQATRAAIMLRASAIGTASLRVTRY